MSYMYENEVEYHKKKNKTFLKSGLCEKARKKNLYKKFLIFYLFYTILQS